MFDKKVLVTGADGFLGRTVVRHLINAGYPVRGLVRSINENSPLKALDIELVCGDVINPQDLERAVPGCKIIMHLASIYRFYPWWDKDVSDIYEVNVGGTKNLLEASLRYNAERFIFTSSVAAMADKTSHYARSKLQAEEEVLKYCDRGSAALILSPGIIFGEGDYKPTPSGEIIVKFLNRQYPCYFEAHLSIADVDDVARAYVAAIEKGRPGAKYILCDSRQYTFQEIFSLLEDISQVRRPRTEIPYPLLLSFVYFDEMVSAFILNKKPLIPSEGLRFCNTPVRLDNSKAIAELGYTITPIRETLVKAVDWYKRNGYVKDAAVSP
ncbi:MAG: NAD-dependent epimerase/dehydratase family protein [Candidatus Omnitrophica bacterium]|nr:NAD-dependent epimerase/dehydratase family protein [Candidatus Omnitrophota bacterium]